MFPSFWAREAPVFLQSRTCHWSSESRVPSFWALHADVLSFCTVEHATGLQKVVFRPSGRSRLLSFCTVEHAVYLQKVLFPSFLETEVVLGELARASYYVTRRESKPCASSVDSLVPEEELQTGLHCTPTSCIYSKRDANAMNYLRYQRRRKKVPPACRGRCLKGCEQSWYETQATRNLGIHEQSYNQKVFAKSVSNLLCFTVCISTINTYYESLSLSLSL